MRHALLDPLENVTPRGKKCSISAFMKETKAERLEPV